MLNSPRILRWVGQFARWVYARARSILVISPGFRRNLLEKGVPADKVHFHLQLGGHGNVSPDRTGT